MDQCLALLRAVSSTREKACLRGKSGKVSVGMKKEVTSRSEDLVEFTGSQAHQRRFSLFRTVETPSGSPVISDPRGKRAAHPLLEEENNFHPAWLDGANSNRLTSWSANFIYFQPMFIWRRGAIILLGLFGFFC